MIRAEWTYSVTGEPVTGFCQDYSEYRPKWRALEALVLHLSGAEDAGLVPELARWLVDAHPSRHVRRDDWLGSMDEVYSVPGVRVRMSIP